MRYSLQNQVEVTRAKDYLDQLVSAGKTVDIKKVSGRRSLNQNNYLYLLLSAFGAHFGYTLEEAKLIYKELNENLYVYQKTVDIAGLPMKFYRSSADLTKDEMTKSIERFREYSAVNDFPLPAATDQGWLQELSNTVEMTERYL